MVESTPLSNLKDASVFKPSFLALFIITLGKKAADSTKKFFVSDVTEELSQPMIPAIATVAFLSRIVAIFESRIFFSPPIIVTVSSSSAKLTDKGSASLSLSKT